MELFLEIVSFLLKNNYCTNKGEFFQQIFGCAMGSKLSPILAQYVMDHLIESCEKKIPYKILLLKKFVDDLFMAIPKNEIANIMWR